MVVDLLTKSPPCVQHEYIYLSQNIVFIYIFRGARRGVSEGGCVVFRGPILTGPYACLCNHVHGSSCFDLFLSYPRPHSPVRHHIEPVYCRATEAQSITDYRVCKSILPFTPYFIFVWSIIEYIQCVTAYRVSKTVWSATGYGPCGCRLFVLLINTFSATSLK